MGELGAAFMGFQVLSSLLTGHHDDVGGLDPNAGGMRGFMSRLIISQHERERATLQADITATVSHELGHLSAAGGGISFENFLGPTMMDARIWEGF